MRFSRIRLTGFKSFVDPTDLLITDGLTGVVGPNGCGKSNLLEALRWVMGETRAKAMRGGGMEDVIFAGASSRPARNFAEVQLQIDNSDRLAPSGFNDSDQLEIVRRITRDVGSAYKVNGKDTRARDVQMLFADASTGAHSPALVRQGQISELINAKPKNRRKVLEDAAGIGGLYQRRHEAELKLRSTEANLLRIDDVVDQLATQLAQLARQAKQAARYRAIGEELRQFEGMLLYRRWREADQARSEADGVLRTRLTEAAQTERAVAATLQARELGEVALPPLREEEGIAIAILQRLSVQRDALDEEEVRATETIATLKRRIDQLSHDMDREANLSRDAGETIERLEWEARELSKASEGHEDALEEAAEMARDAADVLQTCEADLSQLTEDVARLAARHQSAHRFMADCRRSEERAETELVKATDAVSAASATFEEAGDVMEEAGERQETAQEQAEQAEETLAEAEADRAETQSREAEARGERSEAEGACTALRAEVSALAKLLARDTAAGGQIMDQLQVEPGFEKAIGAALSDDLRAPEIRETDSASGWFGLPRYDQDQALPTGVQCLSLYVSAPDVLQRRLTQIGLIDKQDALRLQPLLLPGQRLVSREGDLWRWDGLCAWAEDAPSAAALRLEQRNKLSVLTEEMDHASQVAELKRDTHVMLTARLADISEAEKRAREARRDADRGLSDAARLLNRAEADRNLAQSRMESLSLSVRRYEEEGLLARTQVAQAEAALADLGDLDSARAEAEDIKLTVEASRMTMMAKRSAHDGLRREGQARTARAQQVTKDLSGWRFRMEGTGKQMEELSDRRETAQDDLSDAMALPEEMAEKRAEMADAMDHAEVRRTTAADALALAETALRAAIAQERDAARIAGEAREARARAEALAEAAKDSVQTARARIVEELDTTPEKLLERLGVEPDDIAGAAQLEADISRLKRQRDGLGAVNLRAEEDAREVQEEHDTLVSEKTDLEEAVKTLRSGISSLNREGRERLLTAFEQVNDNFKILFTHLFNGGEANLVMVESDDPLDAGLEIMCQPPGKKLSTLSLLSGGEQTLTALALIFAVFLANPAPICVLDEVDAPLDDANVTRFCDMLDEMCRRTDTRFLIITHHAVTMARMDRLFGVTMQEQGVSQLVSVDLKKAETLVA